MPIASKSPLATLSDPTPPVPGAAARAAVGARADQLLRRRRMIRGAGALACTAVLGVGVVALVSSTGSGSGTGRVETAAAPDGGTRVTGSEPVVTTPIAPEVAPAPAVDEPSTTAEAATTPAATAAPEPERGAATAPDPAPDPVPASVTATASSVPAGVTLEVTLVGDGGTFSTSTTDGVVSFAAVPPGTYEVRWSWQSGDGAAAVGRFEVTLTEGPQTFTF